MRCGDLFICVSYPQCALVRDEVDDAAGDDNRLTDGLAFELSGDCRDFFGSFDEFIFGGVLVDFDSAAHFAEDLDGDLDDADFAFGRIVFGPRRERDAVFVAKD